MIVMPDVTVTKQILTLILFWTLIAPSFAQDKILLEGKGFRNLVIGSSKVDDVIRSLGKPDSVEQAKAEYSKNYIYSRLGFKINFHDDIFNTLTTLPNFDGKTSRGITLKSSLEDIEKVYGSPIVPPGRRKDNAKTWVYDDGVIFWLKKSWISDWFDEIDQIVIYDRSFRRSKK
jgi:Domain of unknown function (DUF4309)